MSIIRDNKFRSAGKLQNWSRTTPTKPANASGKAEQNAGGASSERKK